MDELLAEAGRGASHEPGAFESCLYTINKYVLGLIVSVRESKIDCVALYDLLQIAETKHDTNCSHD